MGFIFISIILYIIGTTPPASGYEISIYDAYPVHFWFFLIGSIACGVSVLVLQAFSEEKSKWWIVGLLIVIFVNLIFLSLPAFRGYVIYGRGDTLNHLGSMGDILVTGHVLQENYYPIVHLLGSTLSNIAGITQDGMIVNVLLVVFYLMYVMGIYLLANVINDCRGQALLIVAFASPLIFSKFHVLIHPSFLSLLMIPFMLYFYHLRNRFTSHRIEITLAFLIMAFAITFCHPVTALFAIAIFFTFAITPFLYRLIMKHKGVKLFKSSILSNNSSIYLILIMIISLFTWYFSFAAIATSFEMVIGWLVYGVGNSVSAEYMSLLTEAEISLSQTIGLFINRYGAVTLYLLVSLVALIFILKMTLSIKEKTEPHKIVFIYSLQFFTALLISFSFFFGYLIEFDALRIMRFALLMAVILNGLIFYQLIKRALSNKVGRMNFHIGKASVSFLILILLTSTTLSIFNVYGSPRISDPNFQVTNMDITGMNWFLEHYDPEVVTSCRSGSLFRNFEDLLKGRKIEYSERVKLDPKILPTHFGYDKNSSISTTFSYEDKYIILSEFDKLYSMIFPENIREKSHQYAGEDIARLNGDLASTKIYTNGEYWTWQICSNKMR